MYKIYGALSILLMICLVSIPVFGQEIEPNNTIETANDLTLDVALDASLSSPDDTLDVFKITAEADKMYTLATVTDPVVFSAKAKIKMDVTDANGVSILTSDPSTRYDAMGARLTGWVPPETGIYYVKIWVPDTLLALEVDPSYKMRFWYGTPVSEAASVHEPDDVVADAVNLPAIPTDGTKIHGYLYNDYTEGD
ncbi:hypothetical protein JW960_02265, partial [candidate division KSB1 bacterium]|nr:hypothetical protein [candidate division KSB1 bacterium]